MQLLAGDQAKGRRTMVFCNTLDSCRAAEHFLVEQDLATVCYHGDIPLDQRKTALHRFAGADVSDARRPALVCTDLAARCGRTAVGSMAACTHSCGVHQCNLCKLKPKSSSAAASLGIALLHGGATALIYLLHVDPACLPDT